MLPSRSFDTFGDEIASPPVMNSLTAAHRKESRQGDRNKLSKARPKKFEIPGQPLSGIGAGGRIFSFFL